MPVLGDTITARELFPSRAYQRSAQYNLYVWIACQVCGKERWVQKANLPRTSNCMSCFKKTKMYSVGSNHNGWKGGRHYDPLGYVLVWIGKDDFFFPMAGHAPRANCIKEHRLVMARHLGRCLASWEVVHHKNGIRNDNRLDNLQLLPTSSQHFPSIRWQNELNKRDKKIAQLEARIAELEGIK